MKKILKLTWIAAACLTVCLSMSACFKTDDTEGKDVFKEAEERVKLDEAKKPIEKTAEPAGKTKELTLGEISGNVYSNDYFGFEFTFPDNWNKVYSMEDLIKLTKTLNKVDTSNEINLEEVDFLNLFVAIQDPTVKLSSSILVSAIKIESLDKAYTSLEKYIEGEMLNLSTGDINSVKFGTKEVKSVEITLDQGSIEKCYFIEIEGYIICITVLNDNNYPTEDLDDFINSINFK